MIWNGVFAYEIEGGDMNTMIFYLFLLFIPAVLISIIYGIFMNQVFKRVASFSKQILWSFCPVVLLIGIGFIDTSLMDFELKVGWAAILTSNLTCFALRGEIPK